MNNKSYFRIRLIFVVVILCSVQGLYAQTDGTAKIVYADDFSDVLIVNSSGSLIDADFGLTVPAGSKISTGATSLELEYSRGGRIIKMAANTVCFLEILDGYWEDPEAGENQPDGRSGATPRKAAEDNSVSENVFELIQGKIRIASSRAGVKGSMTVRTPTAVAGVRGTDFILSAEPAKKDWVCVQRGLVEFTSTFSNRSILVGESEFADTYVEPFEPAQVDRRRLNEIFLPMSFRRARTN